MESLWTRRDAVWVIAVMSFLQFPYASLSRTVPSIVLPPPVPVLLVALSIPILFTAVLCVVRLRQSRATLSTLLALRSAPLKLVAFRGLVEGIVILYPILLLLMGTSAVLRYCGIDPVSQPALEWLVDVNTTMLFKSILVVQVVLVGPVMEEILYRGILVSVVRKTSSTGMTILLTSLFFAVLHGNLLVIPGLTLLGACLAYSFIRTGSLVAPIVIHVVFNAFNVGILLGS